MWGFFCKIANNSLLFAFYSVNPIAMLLQSSMYQYHCHCTPGFTFLWLFLKKCITKFKLGGSFTQNALPTLAGFLHRRHSWTLHIIFLSGKLNATGNCSDLSLLLTIIFGESEGLQCWQECCFIPVRQLCAKRCVIRKLTLLFFPSFSEEKVKILFY